MMKNAIQWLEHAEEAAVAQYVGIAGLVPSFSALDCRFVWKYLHIVEFNVELFTIKSPGI